VKGSIRAFILIGAIVLSLAQAASAGKQLYNNYCASCHQPTGKGIPGAFPPLAGEVAEFADKGSLGKVFPIHVVLFGLQGPIDTFNGIMPAFKGQLKDDQIAAILNYVFNAWGNDKLLPRDFQPYTADEVARERAKQLTSSQVHKEWEELQAMGGEEEGEGKR